MDNEKYDIPITPEVIRKIKQNYCIVDSTYSFDVDSISVPNSPLNVNIVSIDPVVYDDSLEMNNIKISEKYPKFKFGEVIDDVLDDLGGIEEILNCEWHDDVKQGKVVCLLKNWQVFRLVLKTVDMESLDRTEVYNKINSYKQLFDDMDDYGIFIDNGGDAEERMKREIEERSKAESETLHAEKMKKAMSDFFNGGIDEIQKLMKSNSDTQNML